MTNIRNLDELYEETAEMVYEKYQNEAYSLNACSEEYDGNKVCINKLLIDYHKYQKLGSYIECEI